MKIFETDIDEVKIIEYDGNSDNRGFSYGIYNKAEMEEAGINFDYVEERVYFSRYAGTLYGIHFQNNPMAQSKLLYCIQGSGIDYAVDLRKDSVTYLKWVSVEISAENKRQIYIPKGFGHVFISLEDNTRNVMRFDQPFDDRYQKQIAYNDPDIGIKYFTNKPILAPHDICAPRLRDCEVNL